MIQNMMNMSESSIPQISGEILQKYLGATVLKLRLIWTENPNNVCQTHVLSFLAFLKSWEKWSGQESFT